MNVMNLIRTVSHAIRPTINEAAGSFAQAAKAKAANTTLSPMSLEKLNRMFNAAFYDLQVPDHTTPFAPAIGQQTPRFTVQQQQYDLTRAAMYVNGMNPGQAKDELGFKLQCLENRRFSYQEALVARWYAADRDTSEGMQEADIVNRWIEHPACLPSEGKPVNLQALPAVRVGQRINVDTMDVRQAVYTKLANAELSTRSEAKIIQIFANQFRMNCIFDASRPRTGADFGAAPAAGSGRSLKDAQALLGGLLQDLDRARTGTAAQDSLRELLSDLQQQVDAACTYWKDEVARAWRDQSGDLRSRTERIQVAKAWLG